MAYLADSNGQSLVSQAGGKTNGRAALPLLIDLVIKWVGFDSRP